MSENTEPLGPDSLFALASGNKAFILCHVGTLHCPSGHSKRDVVVLPGTPDLKGHPLVIPLWEQSQQQPLTLLPDTDDKGMMDLQLYSGTPVVNMRISFCMSSVRIHFIWSRSTKHISCRAQPSMTKEVFVSYHVTMQTDSEHIKMTDVQWNLQILPVA